MRYAAGKECLGTAGARGSNPLTSTGQSPFSSALAQGSVVRSVLERHTTRRSMAANREKVQRQAAEHASVPEPVLGPCVGVPVPGDRDRRQDPHSPTNGDVPEGTAARDRPDDRFHQADTEIAAARMLKMAQDM